MRSTISPPSFTKTFTALALWLATENYSNDEGDDRNPLTSSDWERLRMLVGGRLTLGQAREALEGARMRRTACEFYEGKGLPFGHGAWVETAEEWRH